MSESEWKKLWEGYPQPYWKISDYSWLDKVKAEGTVIEEAYDEACREIVELRMRLEAIRGESIRVKLRDIINEAWLDEPMESFIDKILEAILGDDSS